MSLYEPAGEEVSSTTSISRYSGYKIAKATSGFEDGLNLAQNYDLKD